MARIRLALCQLDAVVGDLDGNGERVEAALREAESVGADLALFPELVLTGYPPEDLLLADGFVASAQSLLEQIASRTGNCAAVIGFPRRDHELYNSAAICAHGKIQGIWDKELLPNYGVFDEKRWFAVGAGTTPLFLLAGVRVGVTICEDAWLADGPVGRLADGGAELVVSINASPYRIGVRRERSEMLSQRALDARCALAYVNLVGGQDELVFDGGSLVLDSGGKITAMAPQFEEATTIVDLVVPGRPSGSRRGIHTPDIFGLPVVVVSEESARPATASLLSPHVDELSEAEEVYAALVVATRDYVDKNGFREVVIGLSGGIDSSLVATIAADAIGPSRVHGVAMPSRYSSAGSLTDAQLLANNLGIDYRTIPIEAGYATMIDLLAPSFGERELDLTEENLQARLRGVLLMSLSNKLGWLVLTTGNKSETAVGYSTLYGDAAGGFAVLRDVPKVLVYELARLVNRRAGTDRIPMSVLEKAPSAELRPDQRDDDSLPPYEVLDPILEGYVERDLGVDALVAEGFEEETVRRVVGLVDRAEYKRRQAPPGPRITTRGFGKDRRMPITNRFRPATAPIARKS